MVPTGSSPLRLAGVVQGEVERNARVALLLPTSPLVDVTAERLCGSFLLPRLSTRAYRRVHDISSLLFAGAARALGWVYLSTTRGEELPQIARLLSLTRDGTLIDLAARATVRLPTTGSDDEEDLPFGEV